MIKINGISRGTQMDCSRKNIRYKTPIPTHHFIYSLYETKKEIDENNFGALKYEVGEYDFWRAPIINVEFEIGAHRGWQEKDGNFSYTTAPKVETVAVAILGYIDDSLLAKYYNDLSKGTTYFAVPLNDDTVEGRLTKLSIESFEEYPVYYEVKKKTSKSFVFRYREILHRTPYPTHDYPMLVPLEYLQQEFYQNLYVGEEVTVMCDGTVSETIENRLPVVRFWEEVDGESVPQYYTYEMRYIGKREEIHSDYLNSIVEVTLKKVKPETVKQDEDWFFIDKKFGY